MRLIKYIIDKLAITRVFVELSVLINFTPYNKLLCLTIERLSNNISAEKIKN